MLDMAPTFQRFCPLCSQFEDALCNSEEMESAESLLVDMEGASLPLETGALEEGSRKSR